MLYYATHELATDAGIMITGSHNPPNYNGLKFVLTGKPFFGTDIQSLGKKVESGDFNYGGGSTTKHITLNSRYIKRLLQDFSGAKELSVVWDPGNGSSGEIVQELIKHFTW